MVVLGPHAVHGTYHPQSPSPHASGEGANNNGYDKDHDNNSGKKHLRNLIELAQMVDGLVESYKSDTKIKTTGDYLNTALECCSQYQRSMKEETGSNYEEVYIYYETASRIVTQIIPRLVNPEEMSKSLKTIYREIIGFLNKNRTKYEEITQYIRSHSQPSFSDLGDPLLQRFERLKMGNSKTNTVSAVDTNFNSNLILHQSSSSKSNTIEEIPVSSTNFDKFIGKSYISLDDLNDLLDHNPNDILIIDIRRKKDFEENHIDLTLNTIQIEPVSIRPNYTCSQIEHLSLSTNPDEERELFMQRDTFELVIVSDADSTFDKLNEGTKRLIDILKYKNSDKPLKRDPLLLQGGFTEWMNQFVNDSSLPSFNKGNIGNAQYSSHEEHDQFTSHHGQLILPSKYSKPVIARRPSIQSNHDIYKIPSAYNDAYNYNEREYIKNISEYLAAPKKPSNQVDYHQQQLPAKSSTVSSSLFYKTPPAAPSQQSSHVSPIPPPVPAHALAPVYSLSKPKAVMFPEGSPAITDQQPRTITTAPTPTPRSRQPSAEDLSIMTGLANLGNSCYMNCSLQCLIGTKKLDEFFLNGSYRNHINLNSRLGSKGILANGYASLLNEAYLKWKNSQSSRSTYIIPTNFRKIISSLNSNFRNTEQQDCSEFLNYIIDNLHEDLNENGNHPKLPELTPEEEEFRENLPIRIASTIEWEKYLKTNFSIIVDIFQGQYLSRLKCLNCNKTSTTYNPFSTLSLPIPESNTRVSLDKCFEEFVRPEILDGDDKWFCPRCKAKTRSSKTLQIARLPQVLIINLKRFQLVNYLSKIQTFIEYPTDLQLDKYWYPFQSPTEVNDFKKFPTRGQVPPFKYKLFGVINHFGNLVNGHYTAFVDKGTESGNGNGSGWCYFDDTKITKNCSLKNVINKDAYVLFYVRV